MTALLSVTLLICLPAAKGKARLVALSERTARGPGNVEGADNPATLTRAVLTTRQGAAPAARFRSESAIRRLARHTNAVLSHKCLATHNSRPRTWLQARTWHRQAHRAKRGTCAPQTPWPSWWYGQAMCIHRHEAVNWHETSNPTSRGGMQIQYGTWASVGGRGDPAYASPFEQLYRAYLIWKRDGGSWREWTTAGMCGL